MIISAAMEVEGPGWLRAETKEEEEGEEKGGKAVFR